MVMGKEAWSSDWETISYTSGTRKTEEVGKGLLHVLQSVFPLLFVPVRGEYKQWGLYLQWGHIS